ncbi:MAG: DUF2065 family protein [Xanthomonadales bacterium]|jgi:uncharacterized protein YjeT (DUF2065 family)|nr:DUF2065 family protein [Xanthomonadales bacterium]
MDLAAALCLVLVFEGLVLFAVPGLWKEAVAQLLERSEAHLRYLGGLMIIAGLLALQMVR